MADGAEQTPVLLEGPDGATPLGFLAGLGVQRVLAEAPATRSQPRLSWRFLGGWRPVLHGPESLDAIVEAVVEDARQWEHSPVLAFRYLKREKKGAKAVGALRAPVAVLRGWLLERRAKVDEMSLAVASALMCESATEATEEAATARDLASQGIACAPDAPLDRAVLRTYFDFTSRNAQFLEQIAEIRGAVAHESAAKYLGEGLGDPSWDRTMDWDPAADTPGAIYTGYARTFSPVAEWLAFRGLVYFPVTGTAGRLVATACSGRRLDGALVWPVWNAPASPRTVASLIAYPAVERLSDTERRAMGICAVFRAALTKKADGYTGMFAPSEPIGRTNIDQQATDAMPPVATLEPTTGRSPIAVSDREAAAPVATLNETRTPKSSLSAQPDPAVPHAPVDWTFDDDDA